jgi:hypothetical protein
MAILPSGISQTWNQQTPATQAKVGMFKKAGRKGGRRSAKKRASAAPKRRKRKSAGAKALRKGSAAAKAWGRKMARLRKRK